MEQIFADLYMLVMHYSDPSQDDLPLALKA